MSTIRAIQKAKYIFSKLGIKNQSETILKLSQEIRHGKFWKMFYDNTSDYQNGGDTEIDDIRVTYEDNEYLFTGFRDKNLFYYSLHQNEKNNDPECIMIVIDVNGINCAIQGLTYKDECLANKKMDIELKKGGLLLNKYYLILFIFI